MKQTLIAFLLIFAPSIPARSQMMNSTGTPKLARDQYVNISRKAVQSLKTDLDKFQLNLEYHGPGKDKCSLYLSVEPPPEQLPPGYLRATVSREQAIMIIGHLAGDGFLYRGTINSMKQMALPKEPYYSFSVKGAQHDSYFEFIPCLEQPHRWHGMMRPSILDQLKELRAVLIDVAGQESMDTLVKAFEAKACRLIAASANTQTQDQAWKSVVYGDWDRATGSSSLKVNDFLLQESGKSRQFVAVSLWRYDVSLQKWERVNLRASHPIVLKAEKRQTYSRESDQRIVPLTEEIGLLWAEWEEDGHRADTLIFAGPILCEDVDIGHPPEGMIATCVPFPKSAQAMFVPNPRIHSVSKVQ